MILELGKTIICDISHGGRLEMIVEKLRSPPSHVLDDRGDYYESDQVECWIEDLFFIAPFKAGDQVDDFPI